MSDRKFYKTKMCLLYHRGRCYRQTCSFAHGDTEIRQFSASFDDRQDTGDADSWGKERRYSSQNKYSPEKTMESRDFVRGHSSLLSFKRRRKSKFVDGQSNFSSGARVSDGTEAQEKEANMLSPDSRVILKKKLKQVKFDIDLLEEQKSKLRDELEERAQEADSLSSRIQDLEAQLSEEKELCVRITSNIKKFINTQNYCKRLQYELKRSQIRLDKVVDEIDLDALQLYTNEEDSSINIVSDGETTANHMVNQDLEKSKDIVSFANKKLHINIEAEEGPRSASLTKRKHIGEKNLSRRRADPIISDGKNETEVGIKRKGAELSNEDEGKSKRKRDGNKASGSDKVICFQNHPPLPSTSMAAHAMDEFEAELLETIPAVAEVDDEEEEAEEDKEEEEEEAACVTVGFPIPLPPLQSYSHNNYSQYEGDDEHVNVDEVEEDLVEVDIV